jgi:hypothetical protein
LPPNSLLLLKLDNYTEDFMTDFIAVAVADLKAGTALDWVVAKATDQAVSLTLEFASRTDGGQCSGLCCFLDGARRPFKPSTEWASGGPIIDTMPNGNWLCYRDFYRFSFSLDDGTAGYGQGSTMLESAMKALVGKAFGDAVLVPKALVARV